MRQGACSMSVMVNDPVSGLLIPAQLYDEKQSLKKSIEELERLFYKVLE